MQRFLERALVLSVMGGVTLAAHAFALAFYTGNRRAVTTVTGQYGTACEYEYNLNKFWVTFAGSASCPSSIPVE